MTKLIDTYLEADTKEELEYFCGFFTQVIGTYKGAAAVEAKDGQEAVAARGNPEKYYACIRAPFGISPNDKIKIAPKKDGEAVLGVWA